MSEQQKTFTTSDGTALFYRCCPARDGSTDKTIVLFHRGHEHSGRLMFVAGGPGFDDFAYFAWGACGHGHSPGARWSEGLRIDRATGYASGSTLDYVYRNTLQGKNTIGWRGIRECKVNIGGKAIAAAFGHLRAAGKPVYVPDAASGHGRYVLDALTDKVKPDSVRLRDYSPINVAAGRALTQERGSQNLVSCDEVNAFERANHQNLTRRPTLGIVSGLHELFAGAGCRKIHQWPGEYGIFTVSLAAKA